MKILTPNAKYSFYLHDIEDEKDFRDSQNVVRETWVENVYQINEGDFSDEGIFIDLGANIGAVSLYVDSFDKGIEVYAYEPEPNNYHDLIMNINDNGCKNVTAIEKAVTSDFTGMMKITNKGGNSSLVGTATTVEGNMCKVTSLEKLFTKHQIVECDVMKIDIEGGEYNLIVGSSDETLMRIKYLTMEFSPMGDESFGEMVTKIARLFNTHIIGRPEGGGYIYGRRY